jgi:hypothetical protein
VPKAKPRRNLPAIPQNRLDTPHDITGSRRPIRKNVRVASRNKATVLPLHQPMHDQSPVLAENDDRTGLQFRWFAPSDGYNIARPKRRNHASSGDLELNRSVSARNIGNKIATRRLKMRLGNHDVL